MRSVLGTLAFGATAAFIGLGSTAAQAIPTVTVTPPNGARFAPGQRFDLRVQFSGATGTPTGATLTVDGSPITFSSSDAGGFNFRGYSNPTPGVHTLVATVSDSTGTGSATAQFSVINVAGNRNRTKNIIIMLGDGMGAAHRTAARIVRYGVTAGSPNGYLAMDQFPGYGSVATHSLNSIVTDSAPGMGCYTTGNHSFNGQEGVYPWNQSAVFAAPRVEYLSEYLHRTQGKKTGIVSTADIEDATPAANAVHTANRGAGQGICDQYFDERNNTGLTVLLGGGRRWFLPAGQFGSSRGSGNDYANLPADLTAAYNIPAGAIDPARDLIGDFTNDGFTYTATRTALNNAFAGGTPSKLLGLFGYGNMNVAYDKIAKQRNPGANGVVDDYYAPDQPMLNEMTSAAIQVLNNNNPNGFVLMVEGAHIDKQSHLMDADRAIWETMEFDNACKVASDFAAADGNTVVIVLADHECSGFSLIGALTGPAGINGSLNNLQVACRPTMRFLTRSAGANAGCCDHPSPSGMLLVPTMLPGFPRYTILATMAFRRPPILTANCWSATGPVPTGSRAGLPNPCRLLTAC